jgi:hypothetical protein
MAKEAGLGFDDGTAVHTTRASTSAPAATLLRRCETEALLHQIRNCRNGVMPVPPPLATMRLLHTAWPGRPGLASMRPSRSSTHL